LGCMSESTGRDGVVDKGAGMGEINKGEELYMKGMKLLEETKSQRDCKKK
jgi:hypothetical protein